ncbi:MAG: hypothetical protein J0I69_03075 [Altererythrobacter sp.]|nr:hypothetical protein [Altererythrobacter sp.]OJU60989.1 MAG: hypothetical protein BGO08_12780 [Altererythrobacter sp. 66-12]
MIVGRAGSWQTVIADLALILFMVTAAAMQRDKVRVGAEPLPMRGEPLAFYRAAEDAPPLAQWLAVQAPDPRQRLTIVARYAPGEAEQATHAAVALAAEAGEAGGEARIVVEPGERSEVLAMLAFDRDGNWHTDCKQGLAEGAESASRKDSPCE